MKLLLVLLALPAFAQTPDLSTGRKIFDSQCALCHGLDGSGGRGPNLRKAKLKKAADDDALRKAIADGLPPEMPGAWQLSPREVAATAAYVRSLGQTTFEQIAGDAIQGQAVFARAGCANCHLVNGQGTAAGPNLSAVGARRNGAHLRQSVVDPSAFVPDGFLALEVTAADGRVTKGVKANEDLFSIQVLLPGGRYQSFNKASVKNVNRLSGRSTMPAFTSLPAADLDNLVAYLGSLRGTE